MPYSDPSNSQWTRDKFSEFKPERILDVGPGAGKYAKIAAEVLGKFEITGLEIFEPYIERFGINNLYNKIIVEDVREHKDFDYDLVIFGDVLEHMVKEDALKVWELARSQARYLMISIPTIHLPQGESEGNIHETHLEEDWDVESVLETFEGIIDHEKYDVTSTFWAVGKN